MHTEHDIILIRAHVREDPQIIKTKNLIHTKPKNQILLPQNNQTSEPTQKRVRLAQLNLHIDNLITINKIHQQRQIKLYKVDTWEATITIQYPLHQHTNTITITKKNVVSHTNLITVIKNKQTQQKKKHHIQQLNLITPIVKQQCKPAPNTKIQLHAQILNILLIIAQKKPPLHILQNQRHLLEDLNNQQHILTTNTHEHT